jgi:FtsZ-interacting cell division protein ZipA
MLINSTGMISWTPNKDQVGKHIISLNVSDGKDNVSIEFTVNVKMDDTTSSGFDPMIMSIIIIVIIVIIVVIILAIILIKRKKAQKAKSAPLDVPDKKVTAKTAGESEILETILQEESQSNASTVPEMTGKQLSQLPQAQQPQLPPATVTEPAQITQAEKQSETITSSIEAAEMETEPQKQSQLQHEPTITAPQSKDIPPDLPAQVVSPDEPQPTSDIGETKTEQEPEL